MQGELLEALAKHCGCMISDLRSQHFRPAIIKALRTVVWQDHSMEDCNYCLSYILNTSLKLPSYEAIGDYLEQFL